MSWKEEESSSRGRYVCVRAGWKVESTAEKGRHQAEEERGRGGGRGRSPAVLHAENHRAFTKYTPYWRTVCVWQYSPV